MTTHPPTDPSPPPRPAEPAWVVPPPSPPNDGAWFDALAARAYPAERDRVRLGRVPSAGRGDSDAFLVFAPGPAAAGRGRWAVVAAAAHGELHVLLGPAKTARVPGTVAEAALLHGMERPIEPIRDLLVDAFEFVEVTVPVTEGIRGVRLVAQSARTNGPGGYSRWSVRRSEPTELWDRDARTWVLPRGRDEERLATGDLGEALRWALAAATHDERTAAEVAALASLRGPRVLPFATDVEPTGEAPVPPPPGERVRLRALLRWLCARTYALGVPSAELGTARVRTADLEGVRGYAETCAVLLALHAVEPDGPARGEPLRWVVLAQTPWGAFIRHAEGNGTPPWRPLDCEPATAESLGRWFARHPWSGHPDPLAALASLQRLPRSDLALDDPPPLPRWGTDAPSFSLRLSPGDRGVWLMADPMPRGTVPWTLVVRDARGAQGSYSPGHAAWTQELYDFGGAEDALWAALAHARGAAPAAPGPVAAPPLAGSHRQGRGFLRGLLAATFNVPRLDPAPGSDLGDACALLDALDAADPEGRAGASGEQERLVGIGVASSGFASLR